jgi:hypothetical protein
VSVLAPAVFASSRLEVLFVAEGPKARRRTLGSNDNIATIAAVTAIGPAEGDKLLVAEANHPVATIPRFNRYLSAVKHGQSLKGLSTFPQSY